MIRLRYFASLRERLDTAGEALELPREVTDVATLAHHLADRGGAWQQAFEGGQLLLAAVNQESAKGDTPIHAGDEVAFFPPVTGG
jgi:molybdopterin synthase sulfur carrier subunit